MTGDLIIYFTTKSDKYFMLYTMFVWVQKVVMCPIETIELLYYTPIASFNPSLNRSVRISQGVTHTQYCTICDYKTLYE